MSHCDVCLFSVSDTPTSYNCCRPTLAVCTSVFLLSLSLTTVLLTPLSLSLESGCCAPIWQTPTLFLCSVCVSPQTDLTSHKSTTRNSTRLTNFKQTQCYTQINNILTVFQPIMNKHNFYPRKHHFYQRSDSVTVISHSFTPEFYSPPFSLI